MSGVYDSHTLKELIDSDLKAIRGRSGLRELMHWFVHGGSEPYRYTFWYRVFAFAKRKRALKVFSPFAYLVLRHYEFKFDVHVDSNIDVGPGLHIVHGGAVYVNALEVGRGFTIYQGCTLGTSRGEVPEIGNNVTVYAGSIVLGGISVGDGVIVAANSTVLSGVPANCLVAGSPAEIKKATARE